VIGADRNLQGCRLRVTNDVSEDFLKDAENGEGRFCVKTRTLAEPPATATNSGARLELLDLPLEGRREPEIFENSGAQRGGDPANGARG
jgi:hypothetical protein